MVKQHLKRLAVPRTWPIKRKGITFVTRPKPGAHSMQNGMTLSVLLRDVLNVASTTKEVKRMLNEGSVLIDGKKVSDHRRIVGFMDVISFPKADSHYRILFNEKGLLSVVPINAKESGFKLCKIVGKTLVKGKTQLNLSDGRNILVDSSDHKVSDVLVVEVPSQKIKTNLRLEKGSQVYITAGKHIGTVHTLEDISGRKIVLKSKSGDVFETVRRYAFSVGKSKPEITLLGEQ